MRLGYSLCPEELEFLQKRKVVVAEALKQVLQLEEDLQMDEVGEWGSASLVSVPALNVSFQHYPLMSAPHPSLPRPASTLPFLVALSAKVPGKGCWVGFSCVHKARGEQSRERKEGAVRDLEVTEWPLPAGTCVNLYLLPYRTPPPKGRWDDPSFFSFPFPQIMRTYTHPERTAGGSWSKSASTPTASFFPQSRQWCLC